MAEAHPVGFQWVMEAKARGAKVIHVDPRFTRTSAVADTHVPIRVGQRHRVPRRRSSTTSWRTSSTSATTSCAYTNAATIVGEDFQDTDDLDGLFSGFDPETRTYDPTSWQYDGRGRRRPSRATARAATHSERARRRAQRGPAARDARRAAWRASRERDETLQHPRCVYQVLKRHFARYTPEMVRADLRRLQPRRSSRCARPWTANSGRERTTALVYSVGWTQHSVGVQYIRTGAILQLLLGNMGRPGGGIMALRGHASIQGSTDIPTLFNLLPGLPARCPTAGQHDDAARTTIDSIASPAARASGATPTPTRVSLLKAYWGDAATAGQRLLLRLPAADHRRPRHLPHRARHDRRQGRGLLPARPEPRGRLGARPGAAARHGATSTGWSCATSFEIESATFWKDSPEIETGEIVPEECRTEVFLFPAASHVEKEGTFTQTQRMLQWREKAVEPPGDCRSRAVVLLPPGPDDPGAAGRLHRRARPAAARPGLGLPGARRATASPTRRGGAEGDQRLRRSRPAARCRRYTEMKADGSTAGGCWIYTGVYADGVNQAARRKPRPRAVLGRAGVGLGVADEPPHPLQPRVGRPRGQAVERAQGLRLVGPEQGETASGPGTTSRTSRRPSRRPTGAPEGADGVEAHRGRRPVHHAGRREGLALRAARACSTARCRRTTSRSSRRSATRSTASRPTRPARCTARTDNQLEPRPPEEHGEVFPYVFTTYRLTEHHTAGGMSRWLPYLAELQPEMFSRSRPSWRAERGLEHGGWATSSPPGPRSRAGCW